MNINLIGRGGKGSDTDKGDMEGITNEGGVEASDPGIWDKAAGILLPSQTGCFGVCVGVWSGG